MPILHSMTRFWSSDQHVDHGNIVAFTGRPHARESVDEHGRPARVPDVDWMREDLIQRWNTVVSPDDEVWVLGDFAMGNVQRSLNVVQRLNGTLILVPGNHDKCWDGRSKFTQFESMYLDAGFARIEHHPTGIEVTGIPVNVSHFPYAGESRPEHPDRFAEHRLPDDGGWLLCGHVHGAWRQHGRQINVGVDAWNGYPVSDTEIAYLIAAGPADRPAERWI